MKLNGRQYWRSLNQLADTEEFREFLHREFPKGTAELAQDNSWSRRSFLTTMGASLALAGLTGCRRPVEKIVPYVTRPEEVNPGVPNQYATTMPMGTGAYGLVVTSHEGRPTKIEGNALHPSSRGSVNPIVQASILNLYDPDRSQSVLKQGRGVSYEDFLTFWSEQAGRYDSSRGAGLAVLAESFASPTMARLKKQFESEFPQAQWVTWEPVSDENGFAGIEAATGQSLKPVHDYSKAKVILSLDCDFLGHESNAIAATRGFSEGRRVTSQSDDMNRLYIVESALSTTGMMADHRLRMKSALVGRFVQALASELNAAGVKTGFGGDSGSSDFDSKWVRTLAKDLAGAGSKALVVAGRRQPAAVHAMVCALNAVLDSKAVEYRGMAGTEVSDSLAFVGLVDKMKAGQIETLVMLGGNPVYNAPVDHQFPFALSKVKQTIHLASHVDETSARCTWHIPRAHYLESWGDARSIDDTLSVVQPLLEPLYDGKADVEFLSALITGMAATGYELVRETWKSALEGGDFEKKWRRVLHDGVYAGGTAATKPRVNSKAVEALTIPESSGIEIAFYPSVVFDGRFANNGWLQELPDAVTKIAWDNVALFSPKTAEASHVENGDVVKLEIDGRVLEMAAFISPGQADDSIAVALGYGRSAAGRVGNEVGFDTFTLRTAAAPYFASGLKISKTERTHVLANTQDHGSMEGRAIVSENTLAGYREKAEFFPEGVEHPPLLPLWDEHPYKKGYQWGMSIDLNSCVGCNACVTACQSENNIPVIGKEQVRKGREMHWMRLDRYYAGEPDDPEVVVQPMTCQQCEMAPCEAVCPVAATVHDDEGLNVMVYNRCIGTRYCSNNCPYKVRRFNFFNYTKDLPEVVQMVQNPEVTVRSRGVMEKCSYCIQRINMTKITAKNEGREVKDGEIQTACQQACPAKAIVFGNINDPESEVSKLKENDRTYRVLEELNLKPRTSYLAKLRNPHPDLEKTKHDNDHRSEAAG